MNDYEILDDTGFFWAQTGLKAARLNANYGDGYTAGARIGSVEGLRGWALKIDVLPHLNPYLIGAETRALYLWNFWKRHKLEKASEIFLMRDPARLESDDPATPKLYFARFTDDELTFQMFCNLVFSLGGLNVTQARVPGLDPNDYNPQQI